MVFQTNTNTKLGDHMITVVFQVLYWYAVIMTNTKEMTCVVRCKDLKCINPGIVFETRTLIDVRILQGISSQSVALGPFGV